MLSKLKGKGPRCYLTYGNGTIVRNDMKDFLKAEFLEKSDLEEFDELDAEDLEQTRKEIIQKFEGQREKVNIRCEQLEKAATYFLPVPSQLGAVFWIYTELFDRESELRKLAFNHLSYGSENAGDKEIYYRQFWNLFLSNTSNLTCMVLLCFLLDSLPYHYKMSIDSLEYGTCQDQGRVSMIKYHLSRI